MRCRSKILLALALCAMLLLVSGASAAKFYYSTIEEGFQAIENKHGPFIGALARAVGGDYEVLEEEYNWEYWLGLRGVNVNNVRAREAALRLNNYEERAVVRAVYASMAESSFADLRKKAADMRRSTPGLGDESIPTYVLLGLIGVAAAGAVVAFIKLKRHA